MELVPIKVDLYRIIEVGKDLNHFWELLLPLFSAPKFAQKK